MTPHPVSSIVRHVTMSGMDMHEGLGAFVKARRELLGKTLTELATAAELSKSELSALEKGRIKLPGADKRRRLARSLGLLPYELLIAAGEYDPVLDGVPPTTTDATPPDPVKRRYLAMIEAMQMDEAAVLILESNLPALLRHQGRKPVPAAGLANEATEDGASLPGGGAAPSGVPTPLRRG